MREKRQGFLIRRGNKYSIDAAKTKSIILNQLHVDLLVHYKSLFRGKLLDAGCGERPYRLIYDDLVESSVGCDHEACMHDKADIDVFASLDDLPFEDESFDTVLCTNVLEHVANAGRAFAELSRVLKPGGYMIISTPFLYPLHEAPYDFYRYTIYGLRHQIEKNDCKLEKSIALGGIGLMMSVYWHLFITRFLKDSFLSSIDCKVQLLFYHLYRKICFDRICKGILRDRTLPSVISLGYIMIVKREKK